MQISEAIKSRISCRSFLQKKVDKSDLEKIMYLASLSPSGGNIQPWNVYVLTGKPLKKLTDDVKKNLKAFPKGEMPEYQVYPKDLTETYLQRRNKCGEDLYKLLSIERGDKEKRRAQFAKNFEFFGAPVGLFIYINRSMGFPQWADLGIFIQTIMLQAREFGLHTCAQESWTVWHNLLKNHINPPKELMLFCGMAIGYIDNDAKVNELRTERETIKNFTSFLGFD